jgi:hypothetical protein
MASPRTAAAPDRRGAARLPVLLLLLLSARPALGADLAARPPAEDPLAWALREDAVLSGQARSGAARRRTGTWLAVGGGVAVIGSGIWMVVDMGRGLAGAGSSQSSSGPGVLALAGVASALTGALLIWNGGTRRAEAAASWNAAHPDSPVVP